jgi:hypothetical protein
VTDANDANPAAHEIADPEPTTPKRLSLNAAVRRRRRDEAFFLRITAAIAQNERALQKLT